MCVAVVPVLRKVSRPRQEWRTGRCSGLEILKSPRGLAASLDWELGGRLPVDRREAADP
jgi:hypothetical protein